MVNIKKMDDFDFVFISRPLKEEEDKAFSNFLKLRNSEKNTLKKTQRISNQQNKKYSTVF